MITQEVHNLIQRGILRVTGIDVDRNVVFIEETDEGKMVREMMQNKRKNAFCQSCGGKYPNEGKMPKYSVCPSCKPHIPVRMTRDGHAVDFFRKDDI